MVRMKYFVVICVFVLSLFAENPQRGAIRIYEDPPIPNDVDYQFKENLVIHKTLHLSMWIKILIDIAILIILVLSVVTVFLNYALKQKTQKILEATTKLQNFEKEKTEDYKKILFALVTMIEARDSYTAGHSQRVAHYSEMIAKEMGYNPEECELIYQAGILHDIGKIATPDAVLLKPDKLSNLEYSLIKEHVNVGVKMLHDIPVFRHMAPIIHAHHERYDGSGYPNGLKHDEIPPLARIMMVADAFDAMTTNRIYKHKKNVPDAINELISFKGIYYDPAVVDAAVTTLCHVKIVEEFDQTPVTATEQQRFVYFYKDTVTDLYNAKYLETVLINTNLGHEYTHLAIVSLHQFDVYNKQYGWENGNHLLKEFANFLTKIFEDTLLFRIHANDFLVLLKQDFSIERQENMIKDFIHKNGLSHDVTLISLSENEINSYHDLQQLFQSKNVNSTDMPMYSI